ncbi:MULTISPECIES: hypothetical protein [unclassified Psychrobacter]|uniref:hypothetical protein n=1 Tax=unclassified Psychrobacter TaxID=196806 RepID=UPI0025DFAF02|nr:MULTISPECIES: hypothetical protein [unclassified Psychrobacter]
MDNSKDYPVMLYLNGLDSHAIAHDEEAADALKAKGYVTHAEALKIKPKQEATKTDDNADQLAEAYEHIERLEDAMEIKDKQILDLNGEIDAANKRYEEKEQELTDLKNSTDVTQEVADLKAKLAIYEETKDVNGDGVVRYDEMTNAELQKLLEQRKVDYNKRDGKDALIQKLKDSE